MFYLDIPSTGQMTKFRNPAVAWQQFHATPLECDLYQGEEVIAEKYHVPVEGIEGDEYILETHIIEQDAEYVEL